MNTSTSSLKTVGALLFPNFELLDVAGPLEMLGNLPDKLKIVTVAEKSGLVCSSQGISILADFDIKNVPHIDYLFIPGGMGTRQEIYNQALINWIKDCSQHADFTLTVCTGAALLAKTGLLDGRSATTNKLAFNWVVEQHPAVHWVVKARWVTDGNIISSSGVAAGIDMSLYFIECLYGFETSQSLAKKTEYRWSHDAQDDPFAPS